MTNIEFIKKNKTSEIIKDILTQALFAPENDIEWQSEICHVQWLFSEKKDFGEYDKYEKETRKEDIENFYDDLPFWLEEKEEIEDVQFPGNQTNE